MKLAIWQTESRPDEPASPAARLERLEGRTAEAAAAGVRLLVLPEMFLSGYDIGASEIAERSEPRDGPSGEFIASIARRHRVAILYGYPESADGRVYNAARLVDATGAEVLGYRKAHLFGDIDRNAFAAGSGMPATATIDGWRLGVLICYDVEFPEAVRGLALAGVDLVCVPTALMSPYRFIVDTLVATRAYENQVYLAYANRAGCETTLRYLGGSVIVAPDGQALDRAGEDDRLIVATLDRRRMADSRATNTYLADRRPPLYASLADQGASR